MDTAAPQQTADLPPERPRRFARAREIVIQVGITWGLYILSIGPMYWKWYEGKFVAGPTIIAAFYEPLWRLCGWIPWLGRFVNWYVALWIL